MRAPSEPELARLIERIATPRELTAAGRLRWRVGYFGTRFLMLSPPAAALVGPASAARLAG